MTINFYMVMEHIPILVHDIIHIHLEWNGSWSLNFNLVESSSDVTLSSYSHIYPDHQTVSTFLKSERSIAREFPGRPGKKLSREDEEATAEPPKRDETNGDIAWAGGTTQSKLWSCQIDSPDSDSSSTRKRNACIYCAAINFCVTILLFFFFFLSCKNVPISVSKWDGCWEKETKKNAPRISAPTDFCPSWTAWKSSGWPANQPALVEAANWHAKGTCDML